MLGLVWGKFVGMFVLVDSFESRMVGENEICEGMCVCRINAFVFVVFVVVVVVV